MVFFAGGGLGSYDKSEKKHTTCIQHRPILVRSYNPHQWTYKCVTGVTGRGPSCTKHFFVPPFVFDMRKEKKKRIRGAVRAQGVRTVVNQLNVRRLGLGYCGWTTGNWRIILEPPEHVEGLFQIQYHPFSESRKGFCRTPVFVQPSKLEAKHVELPGCKWP